jgi:phage terminase large subunit-like protein
MPLLPAEEQELLTLLEWEDYEAQYRKIDQYFPSSGRYPRSAYPKHLEFFAHGRTHRERCFMAANRVGKSVAGLYELVCHVTGEYPAWWEGHRFSGPIRAWMAGDTAKTTRDILQDKLLGAHGDYGSGLLPRNTLRRLTTKQGLADAVESVYVSHTTGGESLLLLKSYDQRREAFQGTEQDVILLDEEPALDIYAECLIRTMPTGSFQGGRVMLTFTPLRGLSDTVLSFMPNGELPTGPQPGSRYVVQAGWDDVPHLAEADKQDMLAAMPPHQREARTRGIPMLGAGVIYPVLEDDYVIPDMPLQPHWYRAYGLDVGWNRTAAVWGAYDKEADLWYLYSEHYRGQAEPSIHAAGIRARGDWIAGVIDPASRGRTQDDGTQLLEQYTGLGLTLQTALNGRETGIYRVWEYLSTGRLKVFASLVNWRKEVRLYRRDERGNIIKADDHLMDATRYLLMSGADVYGQVPVVASPVVAESWQYEMASTGWMR